MAIEKKSSSFSVALMSRGVHEPRQEFLVGLYVQTKFMTPFVVRNEVTIPKNKEAMKKTTFT